MTPGRSDRCLYKTFAYIPKHLVQLRDECDVFTATQMSRYHAQKIKHLRTFPGFTHAQSDSKRKTILTALVIVFIFLFYLNSPNSIILDVYLMDYKLGVQKRTVNWHAIDLTV